MNSSVTGRSLRFLATLDREYLKPKCDGPLITKIKNKLLREYLEPKCNGPLITKIKNKLLREFVVGQPCGDKLACGDPVDGVVV